MSSLNTSLLISNIFNSRKTILELMEKQGYNVDDYINFSVNEVNSMKQNNQLDILLEKNNPDLEILARLTVENENRLHTVTDLAQRLGVKLEEASALAEMGKDPAQPVDRMPASVRTR
jgi:hypothetical protein